MNIIWIVESGGLCGGVRVIFEYANRLAKRGHKVTIASLDFQPNWFKFDSGVDWWVFPDYHIMGANIKDLDAKRIATWWKTAHFLRGYGGGYYLIQDIETSYYFRPMEKEAVKATYSSGLKMFTPNQWVTTQLDDVTCIGQAYDSGLYKRAKYAYPVKNRVIAIMRKQALKGFSELGEFSRRLAAADKEAFLITFGVMVGSRLVGAHRDHLTSLPDADVVRLYNGGSVFVSTSQHEGFSLSPLEAMACGCPVATTDADGNYFCEDGVNCLKFDKKDMKGMAEGVARILKDKDLQKKLVEGGLETAKQFSNWEPVIDRLEAVLGE